MGLGKGARVGRYVVERLLGVGGAAEVWAVRHDTLGTQHALKVVRGGASARERLLREGRIQAGLHHPHLLAVRAVLDLDGVTGLLMPRVEGPSLGQLLRAYRPTTDEAAALLRAILDGVACAHASGLIHRDLKPGNVLIDLSGGWVQPRVGDFGLVKEESGDHLTRTGTFLGTPAYASPEQLRDAAHVDVRTDLWSLGVLLAQLLQGRLPFAGRTIALLVDAHRQGPDLSGVPATLRPLVAALLQQAPADRPASAAAARARLDALAPPPPRDLLAPGGPLWAAARALEQQPPQEAERTLDATWTPPLSGGVLTIGPVGMELPDYRDAFIGRAAERAALAERLDSGARLVTLIGPGGAGKTRLAVEQLRGAALRQPGSVWIIDLAGVRDIDGLCAATGRALEVPLRADPVGQLGVALRERGPTLLILDSFEHLTAHAEATVGRWLAAAPALRLLVTSRAPLRLRGEVRLTVDVLPPADAAALFVRRAQAAGARIDASAPELAELVSLLDGLPLAIELAATRARLLSPADLRARLSRRFDLLTSRSQQLPPRQRTLRATLAWSWELLSPAEQAVLAQCAVFEQSFSLDAAAAVIALPEGSDWLEDLLADLVDKSLLRRLDGGAGARLGMLNAVHHFVAEKRTDPVPAQRRHAAWFAQLGAPAAIAALHGRQGQARWETLEAESANIIAALRRAPPEHRAALARAAAEIFERRGPLLAGAALLAALPQDAWTLSRRGFLLQHAGHIEEARACYDDALALAGPDEAPEIRLRRANLSLQRGEIAVAEETYRALITLDRSDRTPVVARLNLSLICRRRGERDEATALCRAALDGSRALGDRSDTATAQLSLGNIALEQGDPTEAATRYEAALAAYREVGAARGEGTVLRNLGTLALNQGRAADARTRYTEALTLYRSLGQVHGIGSTLGNLGKLDEHEGRLAEARARYEEALALHRECGFRYGVGHWLEGLCAVAVAEGRAEDAVAAGREAVEVAAGMPRLEGAFRATLARALAAAGRHEDARAEADDALVMLERGGFTLQQAGALAARAAARLAAGQADGARSDLDEAEQRMRAAGAEQSSEVGALIAAVRQRLP